MLTICAPLCSIACVIVPGIVCHHSAVVKVGREHEHIVKDPLHHVLCLLLPSWVERGQARSRIHPVTVSRVVREVPVQILAALINESSDKFLMDVEWKLCLTHCVPPICTMALLVLWVCIAIWIHCWENVKVWVAQQVLNPSVSGLKFQHNTMFLVNRQCCRIYFTLFNWRRCMAKWINSSLPTTSFPCMLPTNFTLGRSIMFSLLLGRLPIPADILKGIIYAITWTTLNQCF